MILLIGCLVFIGFVITTTISLSLYFFKIGKCGKFDSLGCALAWGLAAILDVGTCHCICASEKTLGHITECLKPGVHGFIRLIKKGKTILPLSHDFTKWVFLFTIKVLKLCNLFILFYLFLSVFILFVSVFFFFL